MPKNGAFTPIWANVTCNIYNLLKINRKHFVILDNVTPKNLGVYIIQDNFAT